MPPLIWGGYGGTLVPPKEEGVMGEPWFLPKKRGLWGNLGSYQRRGGYGGTKVPPTISSPK